MTLQSFIIGEALMKEGGAGLFGRLANLEHGQAAVQT